MANNLATEQYGDRATRVFERINNIQSNIENEKLSRYQLITQMIQSFEGQLDEINKRKQDKFESLADKLKDLQDMIEQEQETGARMDSDSSKEIINLERNCKRLLEQSQKERIEGEKKIAQSISSQIDAVTLEVQKEGQAQQQSHQYLDEYLNEVLPRLKDELSFEVTQRKEVEEKIYNQFIEQVNDLKEQHEKERKEKEQKEEELIGVLREISNRIQEQLVRVRKEREKNEEMLVILVEQMVEKMKKEIIELDM
ncbi:hypothetical protein PPERSA_00932 [Pseudocohnilembus persalinus]|uniref:Uncharacterized protein n=1 Tax=Pseudocohnilembus persalinus TaxID=266149 RepID=A0A0V0QER9_PSEPJ|nr:hypothetical protein PPERSA_00932 [Pseudocohnilembus persalinus]|eukprot:KRX00705.1 hypothetical protein PPERSA_00932 [Pseudocohnilembus persalinus]